VRLGKERGEYSVKDPAQALECWHIPIGLKEELVKTRKKGIVVCSSRDGKAIASAKTGPGSPGPWAYGAEACRSVGRRRRGKQGSKQRAARQGKKRVDEEWIVCRLFGLSGAAGWQVQADRSK